MQPASLLKIGILTVSLTALATSTACRSAGLPTQDPGHAAADPEADVPEYRPSKDVLQTSAFEGVKLGGGGGGHEHMNHGGHSGHGTAASKVR